MFQMCPSEGTSGSHGLELRRECRYVSGGCLSTTARDFHLLPANPNKDIFIPLLSSDPSAFKFRGVFISLQLGCFVTSDLVPHAVARAKICRQLLST